MSYYRSRLDKLKADYHIKQGKLESLTEQITTAQILIDSLRGQSLEEETVKILLQKTAEHARDISKAKLEGVVTKALQFVFGSDFEFCIEIAEAHGRPEAEFYVTSGVDDQRIKCKPQDSRGGGIVDIISLALRVAFLQIQQDPVINGPLILDEPGKHVSEEYAVKLATFLQNTSNYFNRQTIMVTHQQYLAEVADTAFEVQLSGGKSVVQKII